MKRHLRHYETTHPEFENFKYVFIKYKLLGVTSSCYKCQRVRYTSPLTKIPPSLLKALQLCLCALALGVCSCPVKIHFFFRVPMWCWIFADIKCPQASAEWTAAFTLWSADVLRGLIVVCNVCLSILCSFQSCFVSEGDCAWEKLERKLCFSCCWGWADAGQIPSWTIHPYSGHKVHRS